VALRHATRVYHGVYMEQHSLTTYITQRIHAGARRTEIEDDLRALGWRDSDVQQAYTEALIMHGAPTPTMQAHGYGKSTSRASALEVVLHFFSFILLGIVVFGLGNLLFALIEKHLPDALDVAHYYSYYSASYYTDTIHYGIAALIVAFPLYYVVMRYWLRMFRTNEGKVESRLSKWLTYLVLLVAAVTVVGDIIAVLFTFLQGEITMRFFLKALTVFVLAGGVFWWYALERRMVQYKKSVSRHTFITQGIAWSMLILISIVLGFLSTGFPHDARTVRLDQARADDLDTIAMCIQQYVDTYGTLPPTLDALEKSAQGPQQYYWGCDATGVDPETQEPYEYTILDDTSFTLCATFTKDAPPAARVGRAYQSPWHNYTAGRFCHTETVAVPVVTPTP
jgi:type II secretory pathway pseudopilin PulG